MAQSDTGKGNDPQTESAGLTRRNFLYVGALTVGGGLLVGCSSSSRSKSSPATTRGLASSSASATLTPSATGTSSTASAHPPTGTITSWWAPPDSNAKTKADFFKYNVTPFQALYPGIKLNVVIKNINTVDQNTQTALAAGRGPDLVVTPGPSNAVPYATANDLLDLGPYYEKYGWDKKLLPWAGAVGLVQGKRYSIPQYVETLVLYYNKTLFAKHGWHPPTSRTELEALCAQISAAGIVPFTAGNADYKAGTEWLATTFWNNVAGPAKVHDALTGKTPWTDPSLVAAIELLKKYFDSKWFGGGAKRYFSTGDNKKFSDFAAGKSAMYISGTWEFQTLPGYFGAKGNTSEFDWVPIPALGAGVPNDLYVLSIGGTQSINAKSKNPDAAAAYLNWVLSDTKNTWAQLANSGVAPLPIAFTQADFPSNLDPKVGRVYTALQDATAKGHVGYTTWTFWGGKADTYITTNIDKVINGDLSPHDFSAGVDAAFQDDLKRGLVPTPPATTA